MNWLPLLVSGGTQLLGKLFGGGEQTTGYQMSPETRQLYNMLMGQMGKGAPGYLTDPIKQRWGGMRRDIKEGLGVGLGPGSGLEIANLMRATAGESRELGNVGQRYQDQLMRQLAGLVGPASQTTSQTMGWGDVASGIGGDYLFWQGLQDAMKKLGGGAGGGQGSTPSLEQLLEQSRFGQPRKSSSFDYNSGRW